MKSKTVSNRAEVVGGIIGLTIVFMLIFGGLYYQYGYYSLIFIFLLIESVFVFIAVKQIKKINFSGNRIVVYDISGKSWSVDPIDPKVELWVTGESVNSSQNRISFRIENRKIANFKLDNYNWEFEEFYYYTLKSGIRWRMSSERKETLRKNYELFLKINGLIDDEG